MEQIYFLFQGSWASCSDWMAQVASIWVQSQHEASMVMETYDKNTQRTHSELLCALAQMWHTCLISKGHDEI